MYSVTNNKLPEIRTKRKRDDSLEGTHSNIAYDENRTSVEHLPSIRTILPDFVPSRSLYTPRSPEISPAFLKITPIDLKNYCSLFRFLFFYIIAKEIGRASQVESQLRELSISVLRDWTDSTKNDILHKKMIDLLNNNVSSSLSQFEVNSFNSYMKIIFFNHEWSNFISIVWDLLNNDLKQATLLASTTPFKSSDVHLKSLIIVLFAFINYKNSQPNQEVNTALLRLFISCPLEDSELYLIFWLYEKNVSSEYLQFIREGNLKLAKRVSENLSYTCLTMGKRFRTSPDFVHNLNLLVSQYQTHYETQVSLNQKADSIFNPALFFRLNLVFLYRLIDEKTVLEKIIKNIRQLSISDTFYQRLLEIKPNSTDNLTQEMIRITETRDFRSCKQIDRNNYYATYYLFIGNYPMAIKILNEVKRPSTCGSLSFKLYLLNQIAAHYLIGSDIKNYLEMLATNFSGDFVSMKFYNFFRTH